MRNPPLATHSAENAWAKRDPPSSRVITPVMVTTPPMTTAGMIRSPKSESPNTVRANHVISTAIGGWSTYPKSR
jgi:hypothetical protein